MFKRDVLRKAKFRCIELKSGRVLPEDFLYYIDLARRGAKIKRGFFTSISHYHSPREAETITRQPLNMRHRITMYPLPFGYSLRALSLLFQAYIGNKSGILIHSLAEEMIEDYFSNS